MLKTLTAVSILLLAASFASADVIVDLVDGGVDSGWSVVLPDTVINGVVVDRIYNDYVRIEIAKTFDSLAQGEFVPRSYQFIQRLPDAQTAGTIQINDENIRNATGLDWLDYHWHVTGPAAFDKAATDASGFSINPFTVKTWGAPLAGWDADHVGQLDVEGGVVPDGSTFHPGLDRGKLYIDVDLTGEKPAAFCFTQTPTPEPGALIMILSGLAVVMRRRRKSVER